MGEDTQKFIKLICLPIGDLSEALGVPYNTVRSWSSGRVDPSPENRQAIAKFMRRHAQKLLIAAPGVEKGGG